MKTSKFVSEILKSAGKSDKEKLQEKAQDFVDNAVIDCTTQIAIVEGEIKKAEGHVTKAKSTLANRQKNSEGSKYELASSFEAYVSTWNANLKAVADLKDEVQSAEAVVANLKAELAVFQDILKTLQGE